MRWARRYPKILFETSWQRVDECDLIPQGDPETVVFLPNRERLEGLYVRGLETDLMLGIRVTEFGVPLSCAVAIDIDTHHPIPVQSNPIRHIDEGDQA